MLNFTVTVNINRTANIQHRYCLIQPLLPSICLAIAKVLPSPLVE
jgi:hypothetical protein